MYENNKEKYYNAITINSRSQKKIRKIQQKIIISKM